MHKRNITAILSVLLLGLALLLSACGAGNESYDINAGAAGQAPESSTEDFSYERALAVKNQTFDPADTVITETESAYSPDKKDYTVLVYMVGSNLESRLGNATADMEEMLASGIDFEKNNVILYTGGSRRWTGSIPADRNCVVDLSRPEEERIVAQTKGNSDMGAPETLSAFLKYGRDHYKSDHYALILWDHGGGPLWGFGSDELFNSDSIMLSELKKALKESPFDKNNKLDWVGFDACLMGSFESMSLWADYAGYYVGSEEVEPGDGWDYSFLNILNETDDPQAITSHIVDSFENYYESKKTDTFNPDITLSVADLSKAGQVAKSLNQLFRSMSTHMGENVVLYRERRQSSKDFGLVENEKGGQPFCYDLVDLGSFCGQIKEDFPEEYQAVADGLSALIVDKGGNVEEASGATLYYPLQNKGQYQSMKDTYRDVNDLDYYENVLSTLSETWSETSLRDWKVPDLKKEENEYTAQLTADQKDHVTAAYYSVLLKNEDGSYTPYLRKCRAEIDPDGLVHIPSDPSLICLNNGQGEEEELWSAVQIESSSSRNVYRSDFTHLDSTHMSAYLHNSYDNTMEVVTLLFKEDKMTGRCQILSIDGDSGDVDLNGKNQVTIADWTELVQARRTYFPAGDGKGGLIPFQDWEEDSSIIYSWHLNENFSFQAKKLSAMGEDFVFQMELEDEGGQLYGSALAETTYPREFEEKKVDTPKGSLKVRLYQDHAEIASYSGTDTLITVPSQVDGKPVTRLMASSFSGLPEETKKVLLPKTLEEIGAGAFYNNYYLEEVNCPNQVKTIGNGAFENCHSLKSLRLPSKLTECGILAISSCDSLEEVEIPSGLSYLGYGNFTRCEKLASIKGSCPAVNVVDDVIYSADGRVLMAYPAGKEDEAYEIPAGTEEIGYFAFGGNQHLKNVTFSEGLLRIKNLAFAGCDRMEGLELPDSLTDIGFHAFDSGMHMLGTVSLSPSTAKIHIGKNLKHLPENAFSIFSSREFEVDEENPAYKASEGGLMNKAGDGLIQFYAQENLFVIPDGTLEIPDWNMLSSYLGKYFTAELERDGEIQPAWTSYDLVIPGSVRSIASMKDMDDEKLNSLTIHCQADSAAEQFALDNDISYDHNMDPRKTDYIDQTDQGQFSYEIYSDHALLYEVKDAAKEITIPDQVQNVPVTVIGNGRESIESWRNEYDWDDPNHSSPIETISLPDTVKEISSQALYDCDALTKLDMKEGIIRLGSYALPTGLILDKIPDTVEELGDYFGSVKVEDGVIRLPDNLKVMSPGAFNNMVGDMMDCTAFKISEDNEYLSCQEGLLYDKEKKTLLACPYGKSGKLEIPEGTEEIAESAFAQHYLEDISLPDSLQTIGDEAFAYSSLGSIRLPASLKNLGTGICRGCSSLTQVEIEEGIKDIGSHTFDGCEQLSLVSFPIGLERIGESAFYGCSSLSEVTFSPDTISIGRMAFYNTPLLIEISLPEGLSYLGDEAFMDSIEYDEDGNEKPLPFRGEKAYTMKIGPALSDIGENAFGALNITAFEVDPENPYLSTQDGLLCDKGGSVLKMLPPGLEEKVQIPEGIMGINMDFYHNYSQKVTDLVLPETLTYIAGDSFSPSAGTEKLTLHCGKESAGYQYGLRNGINVEGE